MQPKKCLLPRDHRPASRGSREASCAIQKASVDQTGFKMLRVMGFRALGLGFIGLVVTGLRA